MKCLKCYLDVTKAYRPNDSELFLSIAKPHKVVCTQTISKWLQALLIEAGVDTSIFKSHSFRHASTSKAAKQGVSIDTIMNQAGWSTGSCVFSKFYNNLIINYEFSNAVLKA